LALAAASAEKTFSEKISGAVTERKALARAIAALGVGDVLLTQTATSKFSGEAKPRVTTEVTFSYYTLSRDFRSALVPRDGGILMAGPLRFQSLPGTESSSGFVVASAARD
jgi:hypothetical protein